MLKSPISLKYAECGVDFGEDREAEKSSNEEKHEHVVANDFSIYIRFISVSFGQLSQIAKPQNSCSFLKPTRG